MYCKQCHYVMSVRTKTFMQLVCIIFTDRKIKWLRQFFTKFSATQVFGKMPQWLLTFFNLSRIKATLHEYQRSNFRKRWSVKLGTGKLNLVPTCFLLNSFRKSYLRCMNNQHFCCLKSVLCTLNAQKFDGTMGKLEKSVWER